MAVNSKKTTMEINTGLVQPRRPQGGRRGCCSPPRSGAHDRCAVRCEGPALQAGPVIHLPEEGYSEVAS